MNWLEFVKVLVPLGWPIVTVIVTLLLKGEIFTFLRSILQRNFGNYPFDIGPHKC